MSDPAPASDPAPTRIEPPVTELTQPFWDATGAERLTLQWCIECERPIWYPRDVCPHCLGADLQWRDTAGLGAVYALSVQHRPGNPTMVHRVPYVVALVELSEGVRMLSNVVDCDPMSVLPGLEVEVCWEPLGDGRNLAMFRPS